MEFTVPSHTTIVKISHGVLNWIHPDDETFGPFVFASACAVLMLLAVLVWMTCVCVPHLCGCGALCGLLGVCRKCKCKDRRKAHDEYDRLALTMDDEEEDDDGDPLLDDPGVDMELAPRGSSYAAEMTKEKLIGVFHVVAHELTNRMEGELEREDELVDVTVYSESDEGDEGDERCDV